MPGRDSGIARFCATKTAHPVFAARAASCGTHATCRDNIPQLRHERPFLQAEMPAFAEAPAFWAKAQTAATDEIPWYQDKME